ncbi:MAG TPA: thioesterase family protein [Luteimonas sp.]|nr:thioesterase family protein [Luteimonas sp.]
MSREGQPMAMLPFDAALSVRWRDLDAFGHVNNAQFLSFAEEARLQWMQALDGHGIYPEASPEVAAIQMNYRAQLHWPEDLVITLTAERVGTTSLTVGHRIAAASDASRVYADGHAVVVWIGPEGRPVPLPRPVREAVGG